MSDKLKVGTWCINKHTKSLCRFDSVTGSLKCGGSELEGIFTYVPKPYTTPETVTMNLKDYYNDKSYKELTKEQINKILSIIWK